MTALTIFELFCGLVVFVVLFSSFLELVLKHEPPLSKAEFWLVAIAVLMIFIIAFHLFISHLTLLGINWRVIGYIIEIIISCIILWRIAKKKKYITKTYKVRTDGGTSRGADPN